MILSERNIDIWYREYVAQYERTTKYAKSRGGTLRDSKMYTRSKFQYFFLNEVQGGTKLSGKKLAQTMAKDQLYLLSYSQASKRAEAVAEYRGTGLNIHTIMQQRLMADPSEDFWSAIRGAREQYREMGYASSDIAMFLGQDFFGSN